MQWDNQCKSNVVGVEGFDLNPNANFRIISHVRTAKSVQVKDRTLFTVERSSAGCVVNPGNPELTRVASEKGNCNHLSKDLHKVNESSTRAKLAQTEFQHHPKA